MWKNAGLTSLTLGGLGMLLAFALRFLLPSVPASIVSPSSVPPEPVLQYTLHSLPQSEIHTLLIPAQSQFFVTVASSDALETVEAFAQQQGAIAALNGGFFDPINHQSTSYVVVQGEQVADPRQNDRLMQNPDLTPYLDRILDRSELRRYECGEDIRYAIALHSEALPTDCRLLDLLGAGPQLLPEITLVQEGFLDHVNGEVIRDALGSRQPNARTALGIMPDGSLLWVMVAQKSGVAASGMSLPALAEFMKTLGVEQALNLDGGSSSSLYYNGETFYGKVNQADERIQRPVKSVLLLKLDVEGRSSP